MRRDIDWEGELNDSWRWERGVMAANYSGRRVFDIEGNGSEEDEADFSWRKEMSRKPPGKESGRKKWSIRWIFQKKDFPRLRREWEKVEAHVSVLHDDDHHTLHSTWLDGHALHHFTTPPTPPYAKLRREANYVFAAYFLHSFYPCFLLSTCFPILSITPHFTSLPKIMREKFDSPCQKVMVPLIHQLCGPLRTNCVYPFFNYLHAYSHPLML